MTAAERPGDDQPSPAEVAEEYDLDVARLFTRAEQTLLGGERRYTPAQVAELADTPRDEARSLWRSLGFATVDENDAVYTDADVEALRLVGRLRACGFDDDDLVSAMTRLFGQTYSRLASWQGQLLLEMLAERPDLLRSEDTLAELLQQITPVMEQLQSYAWRRQLVAYLARVAARASADVATSLSTDLAVGFVDMSGFTSLTRRATDVELRELIDAFEKLATDTVGAHGGRIVKTIGDEVLFCVDGAQAPSAAADIALELIAAGAEDERMPDLRAGLAFGAVVSRLGDVYGTTVNIASRLTTLARPGSVLIDRSMHESLDGDARFALKSLRPESVRGYGHLHPWRLRAAELDEPASER